jgi:thiol-disulfide isomerase/thioredoxin
MPIRSALAVILGFAFITACQNAAAPVAISNKPVSINDVRQQPNAPSKPIEQMSWTGTDGGQQRLGDLKDRVVILDFWATYCPPCREEIPHLNSLQAKYGADKIQIIGLNVGGNEDQPKIPAFVKEMNMSYPVAYPEQPLVSFIFGETDVIPQTAVFDRNGQLVLKIAGFSPEIRTELDRAVDAAMRE